MAIQFLNILAEDAAVALTKIIMIKVGNQFKKESEI